MIRVIRFKIRTLIFIGVICLMIYGLNYLFMPSIMINIAERYQSKDNVEMALVYYGRINRYFPNHWETPKALERLIYSDRRYVTVTPDSFGDYSSNISFQKGVLDGEELELYQQLVDRFPNTYQGQRAEERIILHRLVKLMEEGQYKEALSGYYNFFEKERGTYGHENVKSITIQMVHLLRSEGLYEEAEEILENFIEGFSAFNDYRIEELLGDILVDMGKIQDAKEYYQSIIDFVEKQEKQRKESQSENEALEGSTEWHNKTIERLKKKITQTVMRVEKGKIKGRILYRGKPMEGVRMMLQEYTDEYGISTYSVYEYAYWDSSNSNGEFVFTNLMPGIYGLGFVVEADELEGVTLEGGRFPYSILDITEETEAYWEFNLVETIEVEYPIDSVIIDGETIHFKWQPVEGVDYYTLNLGKYTSKNGSTITNRDIPIYNNEVEIPIEEILSIEGGLELDEDDGVVPSSIFGYYNPNGRYFWGVNAHDANGRIITSSLGYLKGQNTDFTMEPRELRMADQYLLDQEYQKAIEAYESDLEKNPKDRYALYMLSRIYSVSEKSFPYADKEKAEFYQGRLREVIN